MGVCGDLERAFTHVSRNLLITHKIARFICLLLNGRPPLLRALACMRDNSLGTVLPLHEHCSEPCIPFACVNFRFSPLLELA